MVSSTIGHVEIQFLARTLVKSDYSGKSVVLVWTNTLIWI